MARKSVSLSQEDLELTPGQEFVPATLDDSRLVNLESDAESPFLRAQKRVSVRRGSIPKKTATRLMMVAVAAGVMFAIAALAGVAYSYGAHSWRFAINSSDDIEISGTHNVPRAQVMEVMGGDIGRNIFFVPLADRKRQLEEIPWVESATVMRFFPNRLHVDLHERTPVAFARLGPRIELMDASGVVMDLPASSHQKYSFPVIVGMGEAEPISTRAARMKIYGELVRQLDAGGANYSQDLSEVDLSDPDDAKVTVNDPSGAVLVHLGASNYLDRYKIYVTHVAEWRQQFQKVDSVDLRYDHQIIVNPDGKLVAQKPLSKPAARAAIAAGVKPTALIAAEVRAPATNARKPVKRVIISTRPAHRWHKKKPVRLTKTRQDWRH
ncbi:MAG TPA: FtsQ-type POTRA domain-containing protein [Terriglobales bacterium]|nr:FtsQ-type POTRA domain-containing protein [Terriglobales bacterium]